MTKFKRDNWTYEQICSFMQGQKIVRGDGVECEFCKKNNVIVDDVASFVPKGASMTNAEIFELLDSLQMTKGDAEWMKKYNEVLDDIKSFFYDFTRPIEEFGAMGYCEEEDMVYHIGGIPDEMANQWKRDHIQP